MKTRDLIQLLASPFRRRTLTSRPELPARMVEAGIVQLTRIKPTTVPP